jgi:hypothetical protein
MKGFKIALTALILCLPRAGFSAAASADDQGDLLKARELVWRAWFAGDTKILRGVICARMPGWFPALQRAPVSSGPL